MSFTGFGSVPPSNRLSLSDFNGCTLIIAVGGCHPSWQTQYRTQPAVRGGYIPLNGEHAGEEFADVLFFNSRVVRQLRGIPGKAILALVNIDRAAQDAVELLDATPDMVAYANEWATANPGRVDALVKGSVEAFLVAEQAQQSTAPKPGFQSVTRMAPPPPPPIFTQSSEDVPF